MQDKTELQFSIDIQERCYHDRVRGIYYITTTIEDIFQYLLYYNLWFAAEIRYMEDEIIIVLSTYVLEDNLLTPKSKELNFLYDIRKGVLSCETHTLEDLEYDIQDMEEEISEEDYLEEQDTVEVITIENQNQVIIDHDKQKISCEFSHLNLVPELLPKQIGI